MAYASLADIKIYRGINTATSGSLASTKDDVILAACLTRAQAQIDAYCDRTFEAAATATRSFDAVRDVSDDGRTLYLDADLCSITTITNGTAVAVTKYVTVPTNVTPYREIRLKASAGESFTYSDDPEGAITVRGKWAYSTKAPADIVQATIRLAAYMYAQKDVSTFDVTAFPGEGMMTVPQGLPKDVREILDRRVKLV